MDDIIQKLVNADLECVADIEAAKNKKKGIQSSLNEKKKEIYEEYLASQKDVIEKRIEELTNLNFEKANQQVSTYQETITKLDDLYNKNKDRWVDEIVMRCLK